MARCYAPPVGSQSFVTVVCKPHAYDAVHVIAFQQWALRVGLVFDGVTMPYIGGALSAVQLFGRLAAVEGFNGGVNVLCFSCRLPPM